MSDLTDPDELFHELECGISELSGVIAALTLLDAAGPDQSTYWPAIHALHGVLAERLIELGALFGQNGDWL
ncbi:hypothetical protein [Breoghania sp.]|uniref:hypothetical protein n=1 Tax=Breoghania sp. TaxID=2065378 RepID=UPI002AA931A5|nr:hypothetical protein [Breoghania sp.]